MPTVRVYRVEKPIVGLKNYSPGDTVPGNEFTQLGRLLDKGVISPTEEMAELAEEDSPVELSPEDLENYREQMLKVREERDDARKRADEAERRILALERDLSAARSERTKQPGPTRQAEGVVNVGPGSDRPATADEPKVAGPADAGPKISDTSTPKPGDENKPTGDGTRDLPVTQPAAPVKKSEPGPTPKKK